jgi:signal transduction histidine kinase
MALHVSTYPDADKPTPFNFVVIGVGIIILLVTLRQPLTFRENEKLSDNLAQVLDAARVLSSPLDQRTIFNVILDKLKYIVEFDNAAILLLQGTDHVLAMRYDALSSTNSAAGTLPLAPEHRAVIRTGKPSILNGKGIEETSWLGVPLIAQNGVIGLISIQRFKSEFYSQRHAEMALAFACQAAAAIENARLRNREAEAATTAERRRLSRELHDSVSQALFGIALSARSIQEFLKRDPKRASETLDYLLNLTEGALAEMRALIFELRPESLATEGLLAALQKQVLVLCTRHNINAVFRFECEEPPLPIEMKEAIYRVALEALQNTIKHAQATEVEIQFDYNPRGIRLELHDNGRGFNTSGSFPDHYGLIGMRERATNFGGTIDIRSAPGKGTHVYLMIPLTSNIFASHQPLLAEAYGHGAITPPKGTPAIRIGTAKEVVRSSTALRGQTKLPVNKN